MAIWMVLTYFLSRWHKKWVSDYAVQKCLASDCGFLKDSMSLSLSKKKIIIIIQL